MCTMPPMRLLLPSLRRERLATRAMAALCYKAFIAIRASAYLGRPTSSAGIDPEDADLLEWIRLLADVCHNLPHALGASTISSRRRPATKAMEYLLTTASPVQMRWIAATLAQEGISLEALRA